MKLIFALIFTSILCLSNPLFGQTTIQMSKSGGVYSVPCKINGLDLSFIFDTGASDVTISLTEALYMLKNGQLDPRDIVGKQVYQSATGDLSVGTKIILRKIEFAGLTLNNVEASIVHELSAPLLLGQTAMSKLGKFQFDPNNGLLTILNGNAKSFDYSTNSSSGIQSYGMKALKAIGAPTFSSENQYEYIGMLNDGLAYVKKNGLYGYVSQSGEVVIPIKFLQALTFLNGVAWVVESIGGNNTGYFIDRNGNKTTRTYNSN